MNLENYIKENDKLVQSQVIFGDKGCATLIQIAERSILDDHQSTSKAMLILLKGSAIYQEADRAVDLKEVHDYVEIPAHVTHHVRAHEDSLLLLVH